MRGGETAHFSQVGPFCLFEDKDATFRPESGLEIRVFAQVEKFTEKGVQVGRGQNALVKFAADPGLMGKNIAYGAAQQTALSTAPSTDQQAGRESSRIPIPESLFKAGQLLVSADQKAPVFHRSQAKEQTIESGKVAFCRGQREGVTQCGSTNDGRQGGVGRNPATDGLHDAVDTF